MRVLQLVSSGGFFGAENVILGLARGLRKLGQDVLIGTFDNARNPNDDLRLAAQTHGLPTRVFGCRGRFDPATFAAIACCIRQEGIDVVHTHGYKADLYGYGAARWHSRRLVATCHNWIRSSRALRAYAWLDQLLLRRFDAVAAVSGPVKAQLEQVGVRTHRLTQIDNGIDPERFFPRRPDEALRAELGIAVDDVVIGTVGRLAPLKGLEVLLEAASAILARIPRAKFLFVGEGPLRQALERVASERGLQRRVVFTGVSDDVPRVLSLLEVFVLPSLAEGQPLALLEAMSSGLAVVATRVGDVPQMVEAGPCGVTIPPGDSAALADAVVSLLHDGERRFALAQRARQTVLEKYTMQAMAERYQRLYRSTHAGAGPRVATLGPARR